MHLPGGRRGLTANSIFRSTAPHPPLCCSPHADGDGEVWDSARVPSGAPEGPSKVLKATGWDLKSAGATESQPGDQSRLFQAVTWDSRPGTDPCAELSIFPSPQRKMMALSLKLGEPVTKALPPLAPLCSRPPLGCSSSFGF